MPTEPPGSNKVTTTKNFSSDMTSAPPSARLGTLLVDRITAVRATAKTNKNKAQDWYEAYYDKTVITGEEFHKIQLVFVDPAPNASQKPAEKLAGDANSKLLPRATGNFFVKKLGSLTLENEDSSVDNTITAKRTTLCATKQIGDTTRPSMIFAFGGSHENRDWETSLGKTHENLQEKNTRRPQEDKTQEYGVDLIVGNTGQGAEGKYIIR